MLDSSKSTKHWLLSKFVSIRIIDDGWLMAELSIFRSGKTDRPVKRLDRVQWGDNSVFYSPHPYIHITLRGLSPVQFGRRILNPLPLFSPHSDIIIYLLAIIFFSSIFF